MSIGLPEFLSLRKTHSVIDVRSPGEFHQGHIPRAVNIPLLTDDERVAVGTDYKQKGQAEAIRTGFKLVGPRLADIVMSAIEVAKDKPVIVHCWRGGMRSTNFSQFIGMAGVKSHVLQGGYKAYRQLAQEAFRAPLKIMLLTGFTGSGKTEILQELRKNGEQMIDLEGLASHKGSAFGGLFMPGQPTTEQFQNDLFEEINQFDWSRRIWIEDESIAIGKIFLPPDFWQAMTFAPLVLVDVSREVRVQRLVNEYGHAPTDDFLNIMKRITKKLGGQNFNAAQEHLLLGNMAVVMEILLTYYDKAYQQSIAKREDRVTARVAWDGKQPSEFARFLVDQVKM